MHTRFGHTKSALAGEVIFHSIAPKACTITWLAYCFSFSAVWQLAIFHFYQVKCFESVNVKVNINIRVAIFLVFLLTNQRYGVIKLFVNRCICVQICLHVHTYICVCLCVCLWVIVYLDLKSALTWCLYILDYLVLAMPGCLPLFK